MEKQEYELTESELRKKGLLMADRLRRKGFSAPDIIAFMEDEGIPEALGREIIQSLVQDRRQKVQAEDEEESNRLIISLSLIFVVSLILIIIFPGWVVLPVGLVLGALSYKLFRKK